MLQGMFGNRLVRHFSLPNSSCLLLKPGTETQLALTRTSLPNGFPAPTPRVPSEKAFSLSVHLHKPGFVNGWGTWVDGRFHAVSHWDLGGIEIFDLQSDPICLRRSGFDSVHIHVPRSTLDTYTDQSGLQRVDTLLCTRGVRDDVILQWTRSMLPYINRSVHLPQLVLDELILMFCAHLSRNYRDSKKAPEVLVGGLAVWQQERAVALLHANIDGELSLSKLASECGLSATHFARAFKKSFGVPVHRYLILKRVETAKGLLLHSRKPLLTIALDAGFSDQSAFNRTFRALVGTSPGQWRRQHRSDPVSITWSAPVSSSMEASFG